MSVSALQHDSLRTPRATVRVSVYAAAVVAFFAIAAINAVQMFATGSTPETQEVLARGAFAIWSLGVVFFLERARTGGLLEIARRR